MCPAHARCQSRGIVAPLASRASGLVGGNTVRGGRRPAHCRHKDIGDLTYPQLILELTIIPPCCPRRKDSSNNPALPPQLATVQDRQGGTAFCVKTLPFRLKQFSVLNY